jgi:hypothetical protein
VTGCASPVRTCNERCRQQSPRGSGRYPDRQPCGCSWYDPEPFTNPLLDEHNPESVPGFGPQRFHRYWGHDRPTWLIRVPTLSLHTAKPDTTLDTISR